mmetsp:Transcript_75448/g.200388  ORF Transcript_75448/g.200388 Transcript_75448/m.200388 type:complete len:334 (-) Transcript_75448:643-1644(-)
MPPLKKTRSGSQTQVSSRPLSSMWATIRDSAMPNWPPSARPQAYNSPLPMMAREWNDPQATDVQVPRADGSTRPGRARPLSPATPRPNTPPSPPPQVQIEPLRSKATENCEPQATAANRTETWTGMGRCTASPAVGAGTARTSLQPLSLQQRSPRQGSWSRTWHHSLPPQAKRWPSKSRATQCASPQAMSFMRHSFSAMMRTGRPLHHKSGPAPLRLRLQLLPLTSVLRSFCSVTLPLTAPSGALLALPCGEPHPQSGLVVGKPTPSCPWTLEPNAKMVPRLTSCSSAVMPSSGTCSARRRGAPARAEMPSSAGLAATLPGTISLSATKFSTS